MGEPPDGPTENMVAIRGSGAPHFGFAGHLDVVRRGEGWSGDPFEAQIVDGRLVGRGANDMKSAIAAYVAALSRIGETDGTLSLLITGDEEGYATYGTPRIIDWLNERQISPDMILIGEPTSVDRLGDTVKIGRRGSVNMWIEVPGRAGPRRLPPPRDQPHPSARPSDRRAGRGPPRRRHRGLPALEPRVHRDLDPDEREQRHPWFGDRPAQHPLQRPPARGRPGAHGRGDRRARGAGLDRCARASRARRSLPRPASCSTSSSRRSRKRPAQKPELSTSGGTSDGRFLIALCPVVDFGLPNATMHKVGESAAVEDIQALSRIYERIVRKVLA